MKAVLVTVFTIAALSLDALTASAEGKKCKAGQEFDEEKGRCVVVHGS